MPLHEPRIAETRLTTTPENGADFHRRQNPHGLRLGCSTWSLIRQCVLLIVLLLPHESSLAEGGLRSFFGEPSFVFQNGILFTNVLDAPEVNGEKVDAETDYLFRVTTAIPVSIPRTTLVAITQWTPFNENDAGFNANSPAIVYGPVFNVLSTKFWGLDVDALGAYSPAAGADAADSAYTHKLVLEVDNYFHIGKLISDDPTSWWAGVSLYGFLAYTATGLPDEADRWAILTGVHFPIALPQGK